jgi:phosphoribosylformylglycinamidine cyclo-ligase
MAKVEVNYKDAGVDKEAGYESVKRMKSHVQKTFNENVITGLGSFGALYALNDKYEEPILVSGTDGVGTKLKLAFMMDKHDTVGQDLVAMCVNDILCQGAKPLFFLDYISTDKVKPEKIEQIVKGIADACKNSNLALIGGETAEMPGLYTNGEYDLAGFAVGIVDKKKMITGEKVKEGDVLIGIPSSGVHSNGFSLVRKAVFEMQNKNVNDYEEILGMKVGEALIEPTKLYVESVTHVLEAIDVHGIAHITGGGFIENIPRMFGDNLCAKIDLKSIEELKVYKWLKSLIDMPDEEWYGTLNMGIGMVLAIDKEDALNTISRLKEKGETPVLLGEIVKGNKGVQLCK